MQNNDVALKRKIKVDGEEIPGLVEMSDLVDEEGTVVIPTFDRSIEIKNGIKKLAPIDMKYKVANTTNTRVTLRNWFYNNESHDLTVINTDATGVEINRWLLRDCECKKYSEGAYNAGTIEYFPVQITILCTSTPVPLT